MSFSTRAFVALLFRTFFNCENDMRILRTNEVTALTRLSRITIWRLETRENNFPRRIRVGGRRVGWVEEEVLAWLAGQPRGHAEQPERLRNTRRRAVKAANDANGVSGGDPLAD